MSSAFVGRKLVDNSAFQRGDCRCTRTRRSAHDSDFDRIAEHSSLAFQSVWIASAGTLDKEAADPLRQHRRTISHSLAQFSGERAGEVLDNVLDLLEDELRADGLQPPARR